MPPSGSAKSASRSGRPGKTISNRISISPEKWRMLGFAAATSWEEVLAIHRRFLRDYNLQRHWAHEAREDGCHSPVEVLDWHKGTMYPASVLDRILFATRYTRHLDAHGLLRFHHWKLYAERGLPRAPVTVWVYEGSLKIEYQAVTLATYSVEVED